MKLKMKISGKCPLDLLLELSKKQKVDIKDINIRTAQKKKMDFIDEKNLNQIKLSADYLPHLYGLFKIYTLLPEDQNDESDNIEEDLNKSFQVTDIDL